MNNAYDAYIHQFLEKAPIAKLYADKTTSDPSTLFPGHYQPTFWDSWSKHFHISDGLVQQLKSACSEPTGLAPFFTLDPAANQEASKSLVLLHSHYSTQPAAGQSFVRFSFSPIAHDADGTFFFYAGYDRGSLWAGGSMCVLKPDGSLEYRRLWVS